MPLRLAIHGADGTRSVDRDSRATQLHKYVIARVCVHVCMCIQ